MSRTQLPLIISDVSALSRNLRRQLEEAERIPSHVEMLNLLAKAGGYKTSSTSKPSMTHPGNRKQRPST